MMQSEEESNLHLISRSRLRFLLEAPSRHPDDLYMMHGEEESYLYLSLRLFFIAVVDCPLIFIVSFSYVSRHSNE